MYGVGNYDNYNDYEKQPVYEEQEDGQVGHAVMLSIS
jgi:hypothetical protein